MIRLIATRLDAYGHFEFRIDRDGAIQATTADALAAAKALASLGVERPLQLVAHAREWGMVEIAEPSPRDPTR